jgi:hypothetical protein
MKDDFAGMSWPFEDLLAKYGENWHEAVFGIVRQQISELGGSQENHPDS